MKTRLILFSFLFISLMVQAQQPRKFLHGQVINDSLKVENVVIFNINARTGTTTLPKGYFNILARENDTLVFSGLLFKSKKVVITKNDLDLDLFKVKLQIFTNELAEVVVTDKNQDPSLKNKQAIVDKKYADDAQSSPKNIAMPNYNVTENGVNFVRLYKDVLKVLRKNNPKKNNFTDEMAFTELVVKRINYSFFSETLKIDDDHLKLFLVYCNNDAQSKTYTEKNSDFELMDFLVRKNNEFKKLASSNP